MTSTATAKLVCSACWNPIGAGAQPIWLFDLSFHEVCAPRCRACRSRLTGDAEHGWSYNGRVVSHAAGYGLLPTEFWCDDCREVAGQDLAFAQD